MIHRTELHFDRDFTIMPNAWIRDGSLSRKARGLLAELLSHSPGWSVSLASLVESGIEGRDAIRAAIRELESAGYLARSRKRDSGGRLQESEYRLTDPTLENPTQVHPTPKKTISKKTRLEKDIRSFAQRPTAGPLASEEAIAHLRDLLIHESAEVPSAEDEEWLRSLSRREVWQATQEILATIQRWDGYDGPQPGTAAYAALSDTGKRWAETSMLPEYPAVAS